MILSLFQSKKPTIGGIIFKSMKILVLLLLLGASMDKLGPFIGNENPIVCSFANPGIDKGFANSHCYSHPSIEIHKHIQKHHECPDKPIQSRRYNEIPLHILKCFAVCILPYLVLFGLESRLMKELSLGANEASKTAQKFKKFSRYFPGLVWKYVFSIICVSFACGFVIFSLNDILGGEFIRIGLHMFHGDEDYLCVVLPLVAGCEIPELNKEGSVKIEQGFCALNFNYYNRILFKILFWYMTLIILIIPMTMIFWISLACSPKLRSKIITLSTTLDTKTTEKLQYLILMIRFSHFFVIYNIIYNSSAEFNEEFIAELLPKSEKLSFLVLEYV